jgi:magnesium transporter
MLNSLSYILINKNTDLLNEYLNVNHNNDIAKKIKELNFKEREILFFLISPDQVAEILIFLEHYEIIELFDEMSPKYIVDILTSLEIDDAVDIISKLPIPERTSYFKMMNSIDQRKIENLLKYDPYIAGGLMTTEYISISENDSVEQAMKKVIKQAEKISNIDTIFAVDAKQQLKGFILLRDLIISRKGQLISDVMDTSVVNVSPDMLQEAVASTFVEYDLTVLPVVDHLNRILGIITIDDVISVAIEEAEEDYSRLAAVSEVSISNDETIFTNARKRIPWLIVLSFLGFLTSTLLSRYDNIIESIPVIALFMPMILGMAGNTGTQSLAVTIRGLNSNFFTNKKDVIKHLVREIGTGILNGIGIAFLLFIVTYVFLTVSGNNSAMMITAVVSLSILVTLTFATFFGALVPLIINAIKIDPAIASGPFVTMMIDLLSLTIYFSLATILLLSS